LLPRCLHPRPLKGGAGERESGDGDCEDEGKWSDGIDFSANERVERVGVGVVNRDES